MNFLDGVGILAKLNKLASWEDDVPSLSLLPCMSNAVRIRKVVPKTASENGLKSFCSFLNPCNSVKSVDDLSLLSLLPPVQIRLNRYAP